MESPVVRTLGCRTVDCEELHAVLLMEREAMVDVLSLKMRTHNLLFYDLI